MTRARLGTIVAIAAGALFVGAVFGQPGSGRAGTTAAAPTNTTAPTITGTAQEGQTLTASPGTWTGSPTAYAYAWSQCDASGKSCTAIAKATTATYEVAAGDVGHTLEVTVQATNASGSGQATSQPTAVVKTAAPTNTAPPTVTGTLQLGSTLTVGNGSWTGSPTSYAYSWSRCDPSGDHCSQVSDATKNTYSVTSADSGATLRASVTATNAGGSAQATSAPTAVVPSPDGCPADTGTIQIADLLPPARLMIEHATVQPAPVTLRTHSIRLTVKVTACDGRPVQGAQVAAVAIPYDQFAGNGGTTGADGTATITESRESGFPARSSRQGLLAVLVHAVKPGGSSLGGVSTRRTVAFEVAPY
ncbi:MAG TPA: hypothetical protein VFA37_07890 [Gaiellaceae bacterium]|nr:hypothetical protein [Gaiellaceae bacterium]